jgi:hypothetical protein
MRKNLAEFDVGTRNSKGDKKKKKKEKERRKEGREKEQGKSTLDSTTSMLVFMAFSVNTITLSTTKHDFFISFVGLMWEESGGGVQSTRKHTTKNFLIDESNQTFGL